MKTINLTKGFIANVSDEDFEKVSQYKWYAQKASRNRKHVYAVRRDKKTNKLVKMHRWILKITDSKILVDHVNGNGLDNFRENLRICTNAQNAQNSRKRENCNSKFKGVGLDKRDGIFFAYINVNNKRTYLGRFKSEKEAAEKYNEKAKELFKEFAKLNQID